MPDKNDKQPLTTRELEIILQQAEDEKGKSKDDVNLEDRRTNPPKQK